MEIHNGIVGRGEQRARQLTPAEPAHHTAGLRGAAPDFQEVMVGLRGEVQKLDMSTWEEDRGRQCPEPHSLAPGRLSHSSVSFRVPSAHHQSPNPGGSSSFAHPAPTLAIREDQKVDRVFIQEQRYQLFLGSVQSLFDFMGSQLSGSRFDSIGLMSKISIKVVSLK